MVAVIRRVRTLVMFALLATTPLMGLVPSASAASAEVVGGLIGSQPDGSEVGLVGASAVHHNGVSYVFGGRRSDGTYSDEVLKYDHRSGTIDRVARLPAVTGASDGGRQSGAAVLLGSKIYYFGGAALVKADLNGDGTEETVPRAIADIVEFDPATNRIEKLSASLPAGAWGVAAAASAGKAYVFGGFSFDITKPADIQRRDWVLRFEPTATQKVQTLAARLPYAVQDAGAATLSNRIYLFGGLSDNDNATNPCPTHRVYDPDTGEYREQRLSVCTTDGIIAFDPGAEVVINYGAKLPQRAQFLSVGVTGGRAYIPGGRLSDGTASAAIVEFSPSASPPLRTLVPTLPRGVFGAPMTVDSDGRLFMFGGRWGGIAELTDDIVRITPGATQPFPPRSLATAPIQGGIRLTWEAPAYDGDAPVSSYRVYRTEPGNAEQKLADVSGLSYDDTTARPGAQYVYRVTAVNSVGESAGATTSRETDATVPAGVRDLRAYGGNREVLVRWGPPADNGGSAITGYRVYRDGTLLRSLPPSPTEFRDVNVENEKTYSYVVRAVNVKGEGPSVPARTATPAPVPEAPSGLAGEAQATGVQLAWLAPSAPVERFQVYRGELPGALSPYANVSDTTFRDESVQRGRTYYYAVSAANAVGESPPSQIVSVSLVSKPGAPENVFAAPLEGAIHLTWKAPTNRGEAKAEDLRYYVSRKDPGSPTFRILDTGGDLATTAFTDTKVLPGREYVYTVTTLNPLASDPSAEVAAAPKEITNKPPVAFLEADLAEADVGMQVTFDASKSTDPDGSIAYYLFDFGDGGQVHNSTVPAIPHAFLKDGFYTVTVRAVDDGGAQSDPVSLTLKVGTPGQTSDSGAETPRTTPGGSDGGDGRPGSSTGKLPGPGAALVVAAVAAVALALGGRRRRG